MKPRLMVAMGATAAEALTGSGTGVLTRRGNIETTPARQEALNWEKHLMQEATCRAAS